MQQALAQQVTVLTTAIQSLKSQQDSHRDQQEASPNVTVPSASQLAGATSAALSPIQLLQAMETEIAAKKYTNFGDLQTCIQNYTLAAGFLVQVRGSKPQNRKLSSKVISGPAIYVRK